MKKFACILLLTSLASCGGVGSEQFDSKGLTLADENMVKNCEFKGDVTGLSAFYGVFSVPAYSAARSQAAEEAKKLGATHLVFINGSSHVGGTEVFGRAYKCVSR